jgi:homoserine kinase
MQQQMRVRARPGQQHATLRPPARCRVRARAAVAGGKVYIDPVKKECNAFAPATVANLGPGFDWLGCAVEVGAGPRMDG